jgi:copper transport protein
MNLIVNKRLAVILMLILVLMFLTPNSYAHAKLLRSEPADGETLRQIPKTIELIFSEELQTVDMNSIVVTDQNGRRVDNNAVVISEAGKKMRCELAELGDGDYTVEWKALSADDHTMKGTFTFKVTISDNAAVIATPEQPSSNDKMRMDHQMPAQESSTNFAQSAARWLMYLAMMALFGGFAFRLLVLKPSLHQARDLSDEERALGLGQGENRFVRLTWLSLALLAVAALASLILQTSAVLDVSITEAFAPSRLFKVLTETSYGSPWFLQIAAMLALAVVFFIARGRKDLNTKAPFLWIGLVLSAILFLTPSLTGHARAAVKEYQFAIFSDWLHLVAVGIWVGGLFHLALTMPKSVSHLSGSRRLCVLSRVIPLFSRLAIVSSILIVLTGIYNSWIHVDSFSALWNTPYGQVLSIKIILFLPMIALGGLNTFILRPRAERFDNETISADEHRWTDRSFSRSVRVEAAIGIAVLLLAAILAFLPPARQHEMIMSAERLSNPLRND